MTISVVIRAFNVEQTIARAIQSTLDQKIKDFEIVIVNDGSTDGTSTVIESFASPEVRVISQRNNGLIHASNVGFEAARGDFLILLDGDDELLPGALAAAETALQNREEDFAYGDYYEEYQGVQKLVQPQNPFEAPAGAFIWKREKLLQEGGFAGATIFPEYDILLRTWERWKGMYVTMPLFVYHRSNESMSADPTLVRDSLEFFREKYSARKSEIDLIRSYTL